MARWDKNAANARSPRQGDTQRAGIDMRRQTIFAFFDLTWSGSNPVALSCSQMETTMTAYIKPFLASLNDLSHAKTLITADCQFIAVRAETYADLPLYGTFIGPEGLEVFVSGLRAAYDTQSFDIDHVIETETVGAAFGRFAHRITTTDEIFRSHWGLLCTFRRGKIATYRFYEDTAALEEAFHCRTQCRETVT